ncbi:MAG: DUF1501 domain-containing protein [Candidatus Solibacter sp.]
MLIKSRRDFLKIGLKSAAALGTMGALGKLGQINAYAATPGTYRALVCIFLSGGNDGNNTIIPLNTTVQNYATYSGARQSLALSQASLLPVAAKSGDTYGLNPNLTEIKALYQAGKAAMLANVGMLVVPVPDKSTYNLYASGGSMLPVNLFSHSDQQSQWQNTAPNGISSTGWGGRMADLMAGMNSGAAFPSVVTTGGCGPFCTGAQTLPTVVPAGGAIPITGNGNNFARIQGFNQLLTFDNGLQLVQQANGIVTRGSNYVNALNGQLSSAAALQTVFPASNLGQQLKMIARIIQVHGGLSLNRQIFFVNYGGFDTHATQLADQAPLLKDLSQSINAFYNATVELGVDQAVTTFTSSEFGRTLMANSSGGTDHAWGNHHFIVGGGVVGADLYGKYPTLQLGNSLDATGRGTMIPTTSVDQYAATLAKWFGVDPANMPQIFPNIANFPLADLGFMT